MASRTQAAFQTIRTEGALLPADLLKRIADGDKTLDALTPESYHLDPAERINEVTNRAWTACRDAWQRFQKTRSELPESDKGTTLTRDRWLLKLFQELGYGRLQTTKTIEIEGKHYPISHVWNNIPIHLISFRYDLDHAVRDIARVSAHSLVQEYLNRSEDCLWGFVSNGLQLRLLRDNVSFTRAAYVEFDLEDMMEGEVYSDFVLLWLLCHQSRVEPVASSEQRVESGGTLSTARQSPLASPCWLEKWHRAAKQQGTRALDHLRDGVQKAIEVFGQGFLAHRGNAPLRTKLADGSLTTQQYYQQLLRLVYRLIFLFVAEDRDLLLLATADAVTRQRYEKHYSLSRIRRLAERRRGTRHADLWQGIRLIFGLLYKGDPRLGLPALGSMLFSAKAMPDLDGCELANDALLEAVRHLAFTQEGKVLRQVDYRNLGSEELGSVYESLLELHPDVNKDAARFELATVAGSERKTTGSYYTPSSLINCLLDSALEPVAAERLAQARELASKERASKGREVYANRILSGSDRLAEGDGPGPAVLPADQAVSERRAVRHDQPDPPGSLFDTGEHRRGVGQRHDEGVHPVPAHRPGQHKGTGDASPAQRAGGTASAGSGQTGPGASGRGVADADFPDWFFAAQAEVGPDSLVPYSLLAEKALLSLKICDPACGSGHFLIAAANRLAHRLATARTGDDEPSPAARRSAFRDVVSRCIYGVDINSMAVELCKVALWLESLDPGRPLSFLDHRILCGNSLIGATPRLIKDGLPDDAFKPIEGDDKAVCSEYKRRNKDERKGQLHFEWGAMPHWKLGNLTETFASLAVMRDDSLEAVETKEQRYAEFVKSASYENACLLADAWCAAFVWIKRLPKAERVSESASSQSEKASASAAPDSLTPSLPCSLRPFGFPDCITTEWIRRIEANPHAVPPWMKQEVGRVRTQYQFLHWYLVYPDVFRIPTGTDSTESESVSWTGGFDVVMGNPPWERVKLQEKEWFAQRRPEIAMASNASQRRRLIDALAATDPDLHRDFLMCRRQAEGESHFIRESGCFPLCGRGDVNTYAVFAELNRALINQTGRVACIVPSGIATDDTTKLFFQDLMDRQALLSLYDFENRDAIFPGVHRSYKFCLLAIAGSARRVEGGAVFVCFAHHTGHLADAERRFTLTAQDIRLLNPNTRTCAVFRSQRDAQLTKAIHQLAVPLGSQECGFGFQPKIDMTDEVDKFRSSFELHNDTSCRDRVRHDGATYIRLYESKLIWHYDHRWATFADCSDDDVAKGNARGLQPKEQQDRDVLCVPRYYVPEVLVRDRYRVSEPDQPMLLAVRRLTNATNERTAVFALLPWSGCGNSLFVITAPASDQLIWLLTSGNSFPFDYCARNKTGGTNFLQFIIEQLPLVPLQRVRNAPFLCPNDAIAHWFLPR